MTFLSKLFKKETEGVSISYAIAETETSTWNYHIREVLNGKFYYGGGASRAICGKKVAWDVRPLSDNWNKSKKSFATYCKECTRIAIEQGIEI